MLNILNFQSWIRQVLSVWKDGKVKHVLKDQFVYRVGTLETACGRTKIGGTEADTFEDLLRQLFLLMTP